MHIFSKHRKHVTLIYLSETPKLMLVQDVCESNDFLVLFNFPALWALWLHLR